MVKYTRNMAAVIAIALCTACGQDNPTPSRTSTVVTTPPTPPTTPNKCDNIKNPLEEIEWLRNVIQYNKDKKSPIKVIQYTYMGKNIYYVETLTECLNKTVGFANCDLSIRAGINNCGIAGTPEAEGKLYYQILQQATNPIILFEQK
jgi:hypothetical protein